MEGNNTCTTKGDARMGSNTDGRGAAGKNGEGSEQGVAYSAEQYAAEDSEGVPERVGWSFDGEREGCEVQVGDVEARAAEHGKVGRYGAKIMERRHAMD